MAEERKTGKISVLYAASEAVPFIKTGGLADVTGSLPAAFSKRSVECRVVLPKYAAMKRRFAERLESVCSFEVFFDGCMRYVGILTAEENGIRYYFVDNEEYFGGQELYPGGEEDIVHFLFFDRAVLEMLPRIGWFPEVIHCHDWQTGMIPVMLKEQYAQDPSYHSIKTVYTIHNLKFQGIWGMERVRELTGLSDACFSMNGLEYYGNGNMMKGGICWSDRLTTVSETYAKEILSDEYGEGLAGLLREHSYKLSGIVNGIDQNVYDPETDPRIPYHYSVKNAIEVKKKAKTDLQRSLGLPEDENCFLMATVSRLTDQKGLDLIAAKIEEIAAERLQFIVIGTGNPEYEEMFREAARRHPDVYSAQIRFSDDCAHRSYAAADAYLMPSRFEPCGISQLIALRYGTLPIVRETGGLRDTVIPYNCYTGEGNGFSFAGYDPEELMNCIRYAESTYYGNRDRWNELVLRAMKGDYSWKKSALKYRDLYKELTGR